MKRRSKGFGILLLAILGMSALALVIPGQVQAAAGLVISSPTPPASGGPVVSHSATLDLSGAVKGLGSTVALKSLSVTTDQNQTGIASVTAYTYNSTNGGTFSWKAQVELVEISNLVTMTAVDTNNNTFTANILVFYIPYSQSGPQTFILDDRTKAKFTFYYAAGPYYKNLDRFSVVGYLAKSTGDPWTLPFSEDATVSVSAHIAQTGEDILLFTQTIPKNTVTGVHTYRYVSRKVGIQELYLQEWKATETAFYVFVDKINMLASKRASMTPAAYQKFVQSIDSFTITFEAGAATWTGSAALVGGNYSSVKQEMVYNR